MFCVILKNMRLRDLPVFMMDLQTTGSTPGSSDILEIAWAHGDDSVAENYIVHSKGGRIPWRIQQITGLQDTDLANAISLEESFDRLDIFLKTFAAEPTAVIHYARFETGFLKAAEVSLNRTFAFPILCTHEIAKKLYKNLPARGIHGLAGYYGCVLEDAKRAAAHVHATVVIWRGLLEDLETRGITTLDELRQWLDKSENPQKKKYEYPLAKEKRLGLTADPGVYRMLNRNGEVLYVGKATCLRDRVNSYFRGRKNRDAKKLEMLTQVWDLRVTPCASALEAALLEADEIKKLHPKYNVSLKSTDSLVFYSEDFSSQSDRQDAEHPIGPFSTGSHLWPLLQMKRALDQNTPAIEWPRLLFFEELDPALIEAGFRLFCQQIGFAPERFQSMRTILATGLAWYRENLHTEPAQEEETIRENENPETEAEHPLTPEDVANRFRSSFVSAARAYWRARTMTRYLNSTIQWSAPEGPRTLKFVHGRADDGATPDAAVALPWQGLGRDTYDRMSVLISELRRLRLPETKVVFHAGAREPSRAPTHN